jgi:hypothetical protein
VTLSAYEELAWALRNDSALTALIDGRVYPNVVPQDKDRPAIAYQMISGPTDYYHDGPGLTFYRIQLTCEGNTYVQAAQVAAAAIAALERFGWKAVNRRDGYAEIRELPVRRVDVTKRF